MPAVAPVSITRPALPATTAIVRVTAADTAPAMAGDSLATQVPPASAPKPRVVFFGSSTTEGTGASRRDRRYSSLLSQYMGWEEINAGKGGSRLSNAGQGHQGVPPSALMRWQKEVADQHPDRIILMYGANDMHKQVPMSTYKPAIHDLLQDLKGTVAPGHLVVATPQPVLKTAGDRPTYDAALEAGAKAAGLPAIDAEYCVPPEQLKEYSYDNWHLNDQGHALLASYMAAQLTDLGWAPPAPATTGGNAVTGAIAPVAASRMLIDATHPLTAGELHHIQASFTGKGTAVVGVARPNATGGFDLIYKTRPMAVSGGTHTVDVPRWRTLAGDRLIVWTEGTAVAGGAAGSGRTLSVTTAQDRPLRDVKKGEATVTDQAVSLQAIP